MKFLILLLIIAGFIYYIRYRASLLKQTHYRHNKPASSSQTISMVQCARCGVHLPENEAIKRQGHTWCCEEHARLGTH